MRNLRSKDIIITSADKGGAVVLLNKDDYFNKMNAILSDTTTYRPLDRDPVVTTTNRIKKLLTNFRKKKILTDNEWREANPGDPVSPYCYGSPKVHKVDCPLRLIVSLRNGPTYNLSKYLFRILKHLTKDSDYSINQATQAIERIRNVTIEEDEIMVSFDVVSLFTSIPLELAKSLLEEKMKDDTELQSKTKLSPENIMQLVNITLVTQFQFNGKFYEQNQGTPMGSPMSGLLAELVMQQLEASVFITFRPKLWIRYVDDTFVIVKKSQLIDFHEHLNSIFKEIQFTVENESRNSLAFLDIKIIRNANGSIDTCVYRKNCSTETILNFRSNHPVAHKRSTVRTLFKRIETHCSTEFLQNEERRNLFKIFKQNEYPTKFIKKCLSIKKNNTNYISPNGEREKSIYFRMPYIRNVSEATARILKPLNINIAHSPSQQISMCLSNSKDRQHELDKSKVVYSIPCQTCPYRYIGQTGLKLSSRVTQHRNAIRRADQLSHLANHVIDNNHQIDWGGVKVVGRADTKTARETIESWLTTNDSINRCLELNSAYESLRTLDRRKANNFTVT
jgi:hypothetical protein